jgi:hypothetical protein
LFSVETPTAASTYHPAVYTVFLENAIVRWLRGEPGTF